jgi:hypothetical protein
VSRTIEELQRIVADENRTEEERRQAAEHILKLQPPSLADREEREKQEIRNIFKAMLGWDGEEERKRQAAEDANMHVCSSCFLIQTKANTTCELCGSTNGWLVPSKARSDPERALFLNMASNYTIERLRVALYSGWATTPERERVARLLFSSREAKLNPRPVVESNAEPAPVDATEIDFDGLLKRCDREIAAITGQ